MHQFRITLRDDIDADFYAFRILDDAGLDVYAVGGAFPDGTVTITTLP